VPTLFSKIRSPPGRQSYIFCSPNTNFVRQGDRASANLYPWLWHNLFKSFFWYIILRNQTISTQISFSTKVIYFMYAILHMLIVWQEYEVTGERLLVPDNQRHCRRECQFPWRHWDSQGFLWSGKLAYQDGMDLICKSWYIEMRDIDFALVSLYFNFDFITLKFFYL